MRLIKSAAESGVLLTGTGDEELLIVEGHIFEIRQTMHQ